MPRLWFDSRLPSRVSVRPSCEHVFVPGYTEPQLREAVAACANFSETLRRVGLRAAGGNHALLKKWIARWGIDTRHFDADAGRRPPGGRARIPLEQALVEGSDYKRGALKRRLRWYEPEGGQRAA